MLWLAHQNYLSLCRDGSHRQDTRIRTLFRRTAIVATLSKARRGVGVSREPAKLGSEDNSPLRGEGQPAGNSG